MDRLFGKIRARVFAFGHVGRCVLQRQHQDRCRVLRNEFPLLRAQGRAFERKVGHDVLVQLPNVPARTSEKGDLAAAFQVLPGVELRPAGEGATDSDQQDERGQQAAVPAWLGLREEMDAYQARHHVPVVEQDRAGQLLRPHRDFAELRKPLCDVREQERREIHDASEPSIGQQQCGDDQAAQVHEGYSDTYAQQQSTSKRGPEQLMFAPAAFGH